MLDIQSVKESKTDANPSVYGQCRRRKNQQASISSGPTGIHGRKCADHPGPAYGEDGLLEILEVRAAGGQREILVDDCSRQQILRVLEWQSCSEHEPKFDGLVIHLARKD
ncbi:hypothetical protein [Pseudomonas cerasi]